MLYCHLHRRAPMWEEDLDDTDKDDRDRDSAAGLAVRGKACYLFRDDALARSVDEGAQLVVFTALDLLLDRCDARAVLIAHNAFDAALWDELRCKKECVSEEEEDVGEETLRELRRERFADLPSDDEHEHNESESVSERETHTHSQAHSQAHTQAHTLTDTHTQAHTHTQTQAVSRSLLPSLPADKAMPATLREWRVLLHTAKAVREKGAPFEIVLRTQVDTDRDRESDRDTHRLSFLEPSSALYDCYKHVLSLDEEAFWRLLLGREEEQQRQCALSALQEYEKDDGEHGGGESDDDGDAAITSEGKKNTETEEEAEQQKESRKRKRTRVTDKSAHTTDRSRNNNNGSSNSNNTDYHNNEDIADEDGLDEDCDAHRPWGRENFLSARLRREREAEREREKKAARLRAARMLRGHFLLHSDPHSSTHTHEATVTAEAHEQKTREPLEGKDVQQKIRSALKILSAGIEW